MKKSILALLLFLFVLNIQAQHKPAVYGDTKKICLGQTYTIDVLANDVDADGDSLYISMILINAAHGNLQLLNNKFVYTPFSGYIGSDFVYYQICEASTYNYCVYGVLAFNVDTCVPFNNAPEAVNDVFTVCDSGQIVAVPLANDKDKDGDSIFIRKFINRAALGKDSIGGGYYFYTNSGQTGVENIKYIICDAPTNSILKCDTASIIITVNNCLPTQPNRAPVAQIDLVPSFEDFGSIFFDPLSNDTDPDGDLLTWTPLFGPIQGTIVPSGNQWRYIPNPNVNGADLMPYQVCDNGTPQLCVFSVVTFVIAPVNDPPVAVDDIITVPNNATTPVPVLLNDEDIDGDNLYIRTAYNADNGKVELIAGILYYTPKKDYLGPDAFRYQSCDSSACSFANVYINVVFVNKVPVAVADSVKIMETQSGATVDVLQNDYDIDQSILTLSSVSSGTKVTAEIIEESGKSVVKITKNPDAECGEDVITYTVCDSLGACSSAEVKVKLVCPFSKVLPQGFSPNGDGINDALVFDNIADFQPVQLFVFNRWGQPVYESQEYQNDWDGRAQSINQPVPDGTFFYTVRLNDGRKYSSFCIIQR